MAVGQKPEKGAIVSRIVGRRTVLSGGRGSYPATMAAILIEPSVIDHRTSMSPERVTTTERLVVDPSILAGTTTSLGSYCLRWELVLSGQIRKAAMNGRQVPIR